MEKKTHQPPFKPTYKTIAHEAGVSPVTVSLSLHDHPSIPEITRERVRKIAEKQGYQSDPKITELMQHLRNRRRKNLTSNLVALRLRPEKARPYAQLVMSGALARAAELGYALEVMNLDEPHLSPRRLEKILLSRGVEGVILLPIIPIDLSERLNWSKFSVVATSHSILKPQFNTVIPNQLSNMIRMCEALAAAGRERIGLITELVHDLRVNHRFTLGYLAHTMFGSAPLIPPLLVEELPVPEEIVLKWINENKPQVIVTDSILAMNALKLSLPQHIQQPIEWVCTALGSESGAGQDDRWGISENPPEIGRAAIDFLAHEIQSGERGIPKSPRCLEIEGDVLFPAGCRSV
jgi:LacI family transcriptional regulator